MIVYNEQIYTKIKNEIVCDCELKKFLVENEIQKEKIFKKSIFTI